TTNYDNSTDPQSLGSGTNVLAVTLQLGGLANGTTYHFRAVASNVVGAVFGADRAFFTIPAGAGTALLFDGTNDFVNVPFSPSLDLTGPFSIEAWVFRAATGVQHSIVEKYGCNGVGGYVLRVRADDKLYFGVRDDCTTGASVAGATSLAANTWYHVAG